MFCIATKYLQG